MELVDLAHYVHCAGRDDSASWRVRGISKLTYVRPICVALLAAAAARRHRVPLAVTPHYHGTGHSLVRRLLHVPYRPVGAWLLRQAQMVVCVSQAEQRLIHHHLFHLHYRHLQSTSYKHG